MKYGKFIFLAVIIAISGAYIYGISDADLTEFEKAGAWEAISDNRSSVTVVVTPLEVGRDADRWDFKVAFDTHSVELDHDPTLITSLIDDTGTVYQPILWDGSAPGGHHREGILSFDSIEPFPASIEMKIVGVGDDTERLFKWDL